MGFADANPVELKRAGVIQKFDSSTDDKKLLETVIVKESGGVEVLEHREGAEDSVPPISLDAALTLARDQTLA